MFCYRGFSKVRWSLASPGCRTPSVRDRCLFPEPQSVAVAAVPTWPQPLWCDGVGEVMLPGFLIPKRKKEGQDRHAQHSSQVYQVRPPTPRGRGRPELHWEPPSGEGHPLRKAKPKMWLVVIRRWAEDVCPKALRAREQVPHWKE